MDHETHAQDLETEYAEGKPFEAARCADDEGNDDGPEARTDAVDVGYVASVGDRETMNGLKIVVED